MGHIPSDGERLLEWRATWQRFLELCSAVNNTPPVEEDGYRHAGPPSEVSWAAQDAAVALLHCMVMVFGARSNRGNSVIGDWIWEALLITGELAELQQKWAAAAFLGCGEQQLTIPPTCRGSDGELAVRTSECCEKLRQLSDDIKLIAEIERW